MTTPHADSPIVDTFSASPGLAVHWYAVAESHDVRTIDSPVAVVLLGRSYVVWRTPSGAVAAAPDRCPHREMPLSYGSLHDGTLECPYHGWAFGDGGRCVSIPSADPALPVPPAAHLRCVRSEERYGLVWICPEPSDEHADAAIPVIAHDEDPTFRRINTGMDVWRVSATRMVDNFLDIAHFPWVHTGTFGAGQETRVAPVELGDLGDGWFGYAYEVDANNPDEAQVTSSSQEAVVHRWMSTGFHLPFSVRSTIRYADGLEHILLLLSTPIDDVTSSFTFVVWRNDDFSVDAEEIIAFDRAIGAEDKRMLERVPGVLPLARTAVASVQADRCSVEWRRRLATIVGATP